MAGPPAPPPQGDANSPVSIDAVMSLLRDGALRRFSIDIESDSMIAGDEQQEKADRTEFIKSVTGFVKEWFPIIQAAPPLLPVARQMLLFGVRAFRVGRELEEVLEEAFDQLEQAANAPKPPAPPDPEQFKLEATKAKTQAEIQKASIGAQQSQIEGQLKIEAARVNHAATIAEHHHNMREMTAQAQFDAVKQANELAADHARAELQAREREAAAAARPAPKGNNE